MTRQQAGQAPGIVKVRLSGAQEDVDTLASLLECRAADLSIAAPGARCPFVRSTEGREL